MTNADRIVSRLTERGETVAFAESTAGGLITAAVITVPGASAVIPGSLIAYGNRPKIDLLGVPRELLKEHGAVSAECARAMAERVRALMGTTWGVAETGIAGPGGGSPGKPAGGVYLAIAGPDGTRSEEFQFEGERGEVMQGIVAAGLDLLARALG